MSEQKPKLIIFCALAALQDDYTIELQKKLPNSVLLNKNTLTDALLDGKNHTTDAYQMVKNNMYAALNNMAVDQLHNGNTVILHGYYGDKLTKAGIAEYITPASDEYDVRIIYLHCSGDRHQAIISARGSDRDNDKKGDKYDPYRMEHIRNHLRELSKISNVLLVDLEKNNFSENMKKIMDYVQNTSASIQINILSHAAEQRIKTLTLEEALGGFETFEKLLREIKNLTNVADNEESQRIKSITTLYDLGIGAEMLSNDVLCDMSTLLSENSGLSLKL